MAALAIDSAKEALLANNYPEFLQTIADVHTEVDVDDVRWLIGVIKTQSQNNVRCECLRVLTRWTETLVAEIPREGEEVPVRFDMVENAVTLLLDEAVADRTIQERVQFLLDKGVTVGEIRYACKQCGLEFPEEMDVQEGTDRDGDDRELINTGANFLINETVRNKSLDEKLVFLKRKGLNDSEIRKACKKVGIEAPSVIPDAPIREEYVVEGVKFLSKETITDSMDQEEQVAFLQGKGMSNEEIESAFQRAGLSSPKLLRPPKPKSKSKTKDSSGVNVVESDKPGSNSGVTTRSEMVERALKFFRHPQSQGRSRSEKLAFLKSKGLTEEEIAEAEERMGSSGVDSSKVASGVAFFKHPSVRGKSLQEKVAFLKQKGLTVDEIKEAAKQANVSLNPGGGLRMNRTSGKEDENDVNSVASFLSNKDISSQPLRDRVRYLQSQGTTDETILAAAKTLGLASAVEACLSEPMADTTDRVNRGKLFLQTPETKTQSFAARVDFLKSQGLSDKEISEAAELAGVKLPPNYRDVDPTLREDKVQQGARFLLNRKVRVQADVKKAEYLSSQGLSEAEIEAAATRVGVVLNLDEPVDEEVERAVRFLTNDQALGQTSEMKRKFLQNNGVSQHAIDAAFKRTGEDDSVDDEQTLQAVRWLLNPKTVPLSSQEKHLFLSNKNLSKDQIRAAFEKVGLKYEPLRPSTKAPRATSKASTVPTKPVQVDRLLNQAVSFLLDDRTKGQPLKQRFKFLLDKDVPAQTILKAAEKAHVDFKGIPLLFMSDVELDKEWTSIKSIADATGETLLDVVNAACEVLAEQNETTLHVWAKGLLAIAICRAVVLPLPLPVLVHGMRVLQKTVTPGSMSSLDSVVLEDVTGSCVEYIARSYALSEALGDEASQHENVLMAIEVLLNMYSGRLTPAEGLIIARAFHGRFSSICWRQDFSQYNQPCIRNVVKKLEAQDNSRRDVFAFIASGLFRGAADYAWGRDVNESPRPRLEQAMHVSCKLAVETDTEEVCIGVGIAIVYADSHVRWVHAVIKAVTVGLLSGCLSCPSAFLAGEDLNACSDRAKEFLDTELFKLGPQIVGLLLERLPVVSPVLYVNTETASEDHALTRWLVGKLFLFSRDTYLRCKVSKALRTQLTMRIVQYTYGGQESEVATEDEEQKQEIKEDVEGAPEDDVDSEAAGESALDPLDKELGHLASLARLLHMGHLSVVLLGGKVAPQLNTDEALTLWDAMGYLAAYQVRVPETVELEDWLRTLLALERTHDEETTENTVGSVSSMLLGMLEEHLDQDGSVKEEVDVEGDWALAARVEHVLSTGEEFLLESFKSIANRPLYKMSVAGGVHQLNKTVHIALGSQDGVAKAYAIVESGVTPCYRFGLALRSIILDIGVRHSLKALNIRAHQWISQVLDTDKTTPANDSLRFKLALVPQYTTAAIESFPQGTSEDIIAFGFGSILTSLSKEADVKAHGIALLMYTQLISAATKVIELFSEGDELKTMDSDMCKRKGIGLVTLAFVCLRAVPLTILPAALDSVQEIVENSKHSNESMHDKEEEVERDVGAGAVSSVNDEGSGDEPRAGFKTVQVFGREWIEITLLGAIDRTGDTARRKTLLLWYIQNIQGIPSARL